MTQLSQAFGSRTDLTVCLYSAPGQEVTGAGYQRQPLIWQEDLVGNVEFRAQESWSATGIGVLAGSDLVFYQDIPQIDLGMDEAWTFSMGAFEIQE